MRENEIKTWILKVLSKPNHIFNNLPPCPFAKKAWAEGRVKLIGDLHEDFHALLRDEYDLFILPFGEDITEEEFYTLVYWTRTYLGEQFVILDDWPENNEEVKGYNLNFGEPLMFIQAREKLTEARKQLEELGYYKNWEEEYKQDVFSC